MRFSDLAKVFDKLERTSARLEITADVAKVFFECNSSNVKQVTYLLQGIISPSFTGIDLGIGDKLAQQAISIVTGKSVSEIEASYRKTGDLGLTTQELISFKQQKSLASIVLSVDKVYSNLYKIASSSGSGSQEQKIKLLAELLSSSSPLEAKVIIRIATGNLRLGLGNQTILDALSFHVAGDKSLRPVFEKAFNFTSDLGFVSELFFKKGIKQVEKVSPTLFSPIRPALAERLSDSKEIFDKLGEASVEGKYDGLRLQVHFSKNKVEIYSRKQERITEMFPEIVEACKKQLNAKEAILEGEAIAVDSKGGFLPFQATIQRKRKHGITEKAKEIPLRLYCFELLMVDGKDLTLQSYEERRKKLGEILAPGKVIALADRIIAHTAVELDDYFSECVSLGLEGVIAKDLKAPYAAGARKFAWIKLKKSYSTALADNLDVVVIGFYYGKGKRTKLGFGGVLTAVFNEEKSLFESIAKVGTGFTEDQMRLLEKELRKIIVKVKPKNVVSLLEPDEWVEPRMVIEVNADEVSKSPVHTAGMVGKEGLALRFPRFLRVRDDKAPQDATTVNEVFSLLDSQRK
ncbi:MAG: ATP-dependent DNA ligase [Candidatus Micrarchaeota archaeon]